MPTLSDLQVQSQVPEFQTVIIPACPEHMGYHSMTVTLRWLCPECGGPRGKPFMGLSYDGSRRMNAHCWINPCGHIDYYCDVRKEAVLGARKD